MLLRNLIQRKREIVYDSSTKRNVVYLLQLKLISYIYAPKESEHKPCWEGCVPDMPANISNSKRSFNVCFFPVRYLPDGTLVNQFPDLELLTQRNFRKYFMLGHNLVV